MSRAAAATTDGDLNQHIDSTCFSGDYLTFTSRMNGLLGNVSRPVAEAVRVSSVGGGAVTALVKIDERLIAILNPESLFPAYAYA